MSQFDQACSLKGKKESRRLSSGSPVRQPIAIVDRARRQLDNATLSILKAAEVIAVNQDALGVAGDLVWKEGPEEARPAPPVLLPRRHMRQRIPQDRPPFAPGETCFSGNVASEQTASQASTAGGSASWSVLVTLLCLAVFPSKECLLTSDPQTSDLTSYMLHACLAFCDLVQAGRYIKHNNRIREMLRTAQGHTCIARHCQRLLHARHSTCVLKEKLNKKLWL